MNLNLTISQSLNLCGIRYKFQITDIYVEGTKKSLVWIDSVTLKIDEIFRRI